MRAIAFLFGLPTSGNGVLSQRRVARRFYELMGTKSRFGRGDVEDGWI